MKQILSYRSVLVVAPIDEISRQEWDEKVNKQMFDDCTLTSAIDKIKEFCPNIRTMSIECFCERSNDECYFTEDWVGVIYIPNE